LMLRRAIWGLGRRPFSTMASQTPMEDAMRSKITEALKPSTLEIYNDSHLHSHHRAMAENTSKETHFRVVITSESFKSKPQPSRHRMVYALMKEEMAREGGIHALQLRTRTLEEEQKQLEREKEEKGESIPTTGIEAA